MNFRTIDDVIGKIENPKTREARITKAIASSIFSFPYFIDNILGFNKPYEFSEFHKESMETVPEQRYAVNIWPRGHLKTTIWSVAYPIWRLWKETNVRICLVSSALEQSQANLSEIQRVIESNEFLKKLVPESRSDTWNKSQMNTTNGNTCFIKPFSDSARGEHVDYLILDDILRQKDITQEDIKDNFLSIFFPMVQTRGGQMLVVGTPMTKYDLLSDLEASPEWYHSRRAAIENETPIWPQRFTIEELKKIKNMQGELAWQREYMTNPLSSGASIFKEVRIGKHDEMHAPREGHTYFLGVDIAMSEAKEADFTVFSIIEKDKDGNMLHAKQERYGPGTPIRSEKAIIDRLNQLHDIFHFKKAYVEDRGLSTGLVKTLLNPSLNPISWNVIIPYRTGRSGVSQSKESLISRLEVAFSSHELEVLDNQILLEELASFKVTQNLRTGAATYEGVGKHDDTVIALALSVMAASENIGVASIQFI